MAGGKRLTCLRTAIAHCLACGETHRIVHMALLDETSGDVAVISFACKAGRYPSVAARHPPAIRLERAICDLFGLKAVDTPDPRPWLDLGFGMSASARATRVRHASLPRTNSAGGRRGAAPDSGRAGACRYYRAGTFPVHRQRRTCGAAGATARLGAQRHRVFDERRDTCGGGKACLARFRRQHGGLCLCLRAGGQKPRCR